MARREPQPSRVIAGGPRLRSWVLLGGLALALVAAGYLGGRWHLQELLDDTAQLSSEAFERQLQRQGEQIVQLQKQRAAARVDAEISQRTLAALQATLVRQQRTIAGLREEVSIWRGLSEGTEGRDLKIRSWSVWALPQPDQFAYRLVIQQRSAHGKEVEGSALVELIGIDANGTELTIPLSELSATHSQPQIELRFSHFQALEGELTLRAGFTPQRVRVTAASGSGASKVSKRYAWAVREVAEDVDKG